MSEPQPWRAPIFQVLDAPSPPGKPPVEPEELLAQAEAEAEQLLLLTRRRAEAEAERMRQEARQQGYSDGLTEAAAAYAEERRQRQQQFRDSLAGLSSELERRWDRMMEELSESVGLLAWEALRKMLGEQERGNLPVQEIRRAIESLAGEDTPLIRVHPLDQTRWPSDLPIRIETREDLEPGDFELVTASGVINGSYEVRLQRIREALLNPAAQK